MLHTIIAQHFLLPQFDYAIQFEKNKFMLSLILNRAYKHYIDFETLKVRSHKRNKMANCSTN
jgi:hypothetical protein